MLQTVFENLCFHEQRFASVSHSQKATFQRRELPRLRVVPVSAAGVKQRWGYGSVLRRLAVVRAEAPLSELSFTGVWEAGSCSARPCASVWPCVLTARENTHF